MPKNLHKEATDMLVATSRTFSIPISFLPDQLKEAVMSAYLCMRAIDEIEDHSNLSANVKINLLREVSDVLKPPFNLDELETLIKPYQNLLPEVSYRLTDWIKVCPTAATPPVLDATAIMADGMAKWVERDFEVNNEKDLDEYTYYVAGLVGKMLTDLWSWYDNIEADEELAIGFGRGLQAVNIIRNRDEDLERGVDFFPNGWQMADMFQYAHRNLSLADQYLEKIKEGPIYHFCKIPLALAKGTLEAIEKGQEKLSRTEVVNIVSKVAGE